MPCARARVHSLLSLKLSFRLDEARTYATLHPHPRCHFVTISFSPHARAEYNHAPDQHKVHGRRISFLPHLYIPVFGFTAYEYAPPAPPSRFQYTIAYKYIEISVQAPSVPKYMSTGALAFPTRNHFNGMRISLPFCIIHTVHCVYTACTIV